MRIQTIQRSRPEIGDPLSICYGWFNKKRSLGKITGLQFSPVWGMYILEVSFDDGYTNSYLENKLVWGRGQWENYESWLYR